MVRITTRRERRVAVRTVPSLAVGVLDSVQAMTPRFVPPSRARRAATHVFAASALIALSLFVLALASRAWS